MRPHTLLGMNRMSRTWNMTMLYSVHQQFCRRGSSTAMTLSQIVCALMRSLSASILIAHRKRMLVVIKLLCTKNKLNKCVCVDRILNTLTKSIYWQLAYFMWICVRLDMSGGIGGIDINRAILDEMFLVQKFLMSTLKNENPTFSSFTPFFFSFACLFVPSQAVTALAINILSRCFNSSSSNIIVEWFLFSLFCLCFKWNSANEICMRVWVSVCVCAREYETLKNKELSISRNSILLSILNSRAFVLCHEIWASSTKGDTFCQRHQKRRWQRVLWKKMLNECAIWVFHKSL